MATKQKHKERSQYRSHYKGIPATFGHNAEITATKKQAAQFRSAGILSNVLRKLSRARESRTAKTEEG